MKICFLAGANSIHSKRWVKYFAENGHEVYWLSLGIGTDEVIKKSKFILIKKFFLKPLRPLFYIISIKKILNKIKPDIFHIHQVWIDGIIGAFCGFHPFILTAWGSDILITPKSKIKKLFIKYALRKADLITCDAEHMRKEMIKLGTNSSKTKIINFGVDTIKFSPGDKNENLIRKLKIENCQIVISLRNLKSIYNVETFIRAIPLIFKEVPKVRFIIAGKGPEKEKLKNIVKELKISKIIRFVDWIPNEELPEYLRTADVYVSTSLYDAGIASSTAEAMACGLPVVVTNTGENEKWIEDGKSGFIIPAKDPKILAEKVVYLLKYKKKRKEFANRARKTIIEKNSYYKEMAKMNGLYKKLVNIYNK